MTELTARAEIGHRAIGVHPALTQAPQPLGVCGFPAVAVHVAVRDQRTCGRVDRDRPIMVGPEQPGGRGALGVRQL